MNKNNGLRLWQVVLAVTLWAATMAAPAGAQSTEPFNFSADIAPSVESFKMTQFGSVAPSLYTGAVTYSLPLYTYQDEDFTIPISLEYSYDGYKPSQHSGTVGLGWALNCGGVITREVRGYPDEKLDTDEDICGYYYTIKDHVLNPVSTQYTIASGKIHQSIMNYLTSRSYYYSDVFADEPYYGELYSLQGGDWVNRYDPSPDLFHFQFLSYSGDFMMDESGELVAFNTNVPAKEISITYDLEKIVGGYFAPEIIINTGDGYRYIFGGQLNATDRSFSRPGTTPPTITAWHLRRIESPNGRNVEWIYGASFQRDLSLSKYYPSELVVPWQGSPSGYDNYGFMGGGIYFRTDNSCYPLLQRVEVDGIPMTDFCYEVKPVDENDNTNYIYPNYVVRGTDSTVPLDTCARALSAVRVWNRMHERVDSIAFVHSYVSNPYSAKKTFLESVSSLKGGRHTFSYHGISSYNSLPCSDTGAIDHWGFWNGSSLTTYNLKNYIRTNNNLGLYEQLTSNTIRYSNVEYTKTGALERIIYPTGGYSDIDYEGNSASMLFERSMYDAPDFINNTTGQTVGGIRVRSVRNYSNGEHWDISYSYSTTNGVSSGILFQMPRYGTSLGYYREMTFYNSDWGLSTTNARIIATGYTDECNKGMLRDPFIGYSLVRAFYEDGSETRYRFSGPDDYMDDYLDSYAVDAVHYTKTVESLRDSIVCDNGGKEMAAKAVLPPTVDRKNMRGLLLEKKELDADGILQSRIVNHYREIVGFSTRSCFNNLVSFAMIRQTWKCPQLDWTTEEKYEHDGDYAITTRKVYDYNENGQKAKESTYSPTDTTTTRYLYYHEANNYNSLQDCPAHLRQALAAVAQTRTDDSGTYLLQTERYTYNVASGNPRPVRIDTYSTDSPQPVSFFASLFAAPAGYKQKTINLTYDASSHRLLRADLPGGAYLTYTWDTAGKHILSKTVNDSRNSWTYTWKDDIGLTNLTDPTGQGEYYSYDSHNRLCRTDDHAYRKVTEWEYYLINAILLPGEPSLDWGRSGIRKRTFTNGDNLTAHSFLDAEYYDGLGFLEQTVAAKGAPTGKSIVRPVVYDLMRRDDARVYLPYAVTGQTGAWESGAVTAQGAWYAGVDARPWSDTDYESGLSGRPTSVMREGAAWATNHKSATMRYDLNDGISEEDVLNLKYAQGQGGAPDTVRVAGTATALTLFVTTATDEDGSTVQTFTDAEGRTVLERRFSGLGGQGIVSDTYTVYDRYGRVVCVVQPEGAEQLESGNPTSFTFDSAFAQQWCFTYGYDAWGNVIRRHVPGAGTEKTLYDSRGRAVLHADAALQAAGKWQYTLYDAMDRVTEEGYAGLANSEATVRAQLENAAGNSATLLNACLTGKAVTRTAIYWESAGTLTGFVPISGLSLYQNGNYCRTLLAQETLYAVPSIGSNGTLQQASFSRTRKYFYDDKGRVIQLQETDSDGWSARYSTQYDFLGNVVKTKEEHIAPGGRTDDLTVSNTLTDRGVVLSSTVTANGTGHTTTYSYDDLGRMTGKQVAFGNAGNAVSEQYDWDVHGWQTSHLVKVKGTQVWGRRYRRTDVSPADSMTAWPAIGADVAEEEIIGEAFLEEEVVEDEIEDLGWPYSPKASWTGRIAETETAWTSGGSATRRAYRYDGMGRLRSATTRTDDDWNGLPEGEAPLQFYDILTDEHYTYDRNGNILTLTRLNGTEYAAISFTRTGNRLTAADVNGSYSFNHNANGAMTFDSMIGEEGATLSWNAAGLLYSITDEESGEWVTYLWLSDGTKVKMDGDVDSPRYYRGSFVYKDVSISVPTGYDEGDYDTYDFEGLESIAHSEGRFVATDWTTTGVPTLSDRHFVRDLVGSTVTVIDVARAAVASNIPTLNAALVEQDAYLAYGDRLSASAMTLKTDTDNRYRFNGKERHDWAGYAYIDYGARMYNPLIGSWLSPDPLADKYTSTSPYVFCAGDPVNYVDPTGLDWIMACYDGETFYFFDEKVNSEDGISNYYSDNRKKYDIKYVGKTKTVTASDGTVFTLNEDGSYTKGNEAASFEEYAEEGKLHIGNSMNTIQEDSRNWYGTYCGPNNPKNANNPKIDSYAKPPIDALDYAAFRHDKGYDAVGAQGKTDAILNVCTVPADLRLIIESIMSVGKGANVIYALGTASIFSVLSGFKITHPRLTIIPLILHQYEK